MPDANGWPVTTEITAKIATAVDLTQVSAAGIADIPNILASVILEFQSPCGRRGDGGTGRTFTKVTETRTFDGNGQAEMYVGDIVPSITNADGSIAYPLLVKAYDYQIVDVVLKSNYHGLGFGVLSIPNTGSFYGSYAAGMTGNFPRGHQNVNVTATWGYAATVPLDIFQAVIGEVAARVLKQTAGGLLGLPKAIKNQDSDVQFDNKSGAILYWNDLYKSALLKYRDDGMWKVKGLAKRMS